MAMVKGSDVLKFFGAALAFYAAVIALAWWAGEPTSPYRESCVKLADRLWKQHKAKIAISQADLDHAKVCTSDMGSNSRYP